MSKTLEFWFEFASSYSYLSVMRIEPLAREAPGSRWLGGLLGPVFLSLGWNDSPFNIYPPRAATCGATWRGWPRATACPSGCRRAFRAAACSPRGWRCWAPRRGLDGRLRPRRDAQPTLPTTGTSPSRR